MPEHLNRAEAPDNPPLLTKEQAAQLLSTSLSHLDRLIEEGHLGHVKVGRFIRLTHADIHTYITNAHVAPKGISE